MDPNSKTTPSTSSNGNGLAITALVIGIVAFFMGWTGPLGIVLGIVAVIFGIVALAKKQSKPMSIIGLSLGAIALLFALVMTVFGVALFQAADEASKESNVSEQSQGSEPKSSEKWNLNEAYGKVKNGMSKEEVEKATGKKSQSCSTVEDESFGKMESCTYGNMFIDDGSISVTYDNDGKVSSKSKYEN